MTILIFVFITLCFCQQYCLLLISVFPATNVPLTFHLVTLSFLVLSPSLLTVHFRFYIYIALPRVIPSSLIFIWSLVILQQLPTPPLPSSSSTTKYKPLIHTGPRAASITVALSPSCSMVSSCTTWQKACYSKTSTISLTTIGTNPWGERTGWRSYSPTRCPKPWVIKTKSKWRVFFFSMRVDRQ